MKVIIIYSGKGGVGKTTTTVNLAKTLTASGSKVFILDADVNTPSLGVIFKDPNPEKNLCISSLGFDERPVYIQSSMIKKFISDSIKQINEFKPDYVLVDTPPSITDVHINLIEKLKVSGLLMVTQPSDLSISDVNRTAVFFKSREIEVIGIIENMVTKSSKSNTYVWPTLARVPFATDFEMKTAFTQSSDQYKKIAEALTDLEAVLLENKKMEYFDESITLQDKGVFDPDSEYFDFFSAAKYANKAKFLNVVTWDKLRYMIMDGQLMPDRLLQECTAERCGRLLKAFEEDERAYFMVVNAPNTEINLFPGEIGQCSLRLDEVHYGIPRVKYQTGKGDVTLFPHEVKPATKEDIQAALADGSIQTSDGRYIPHVDVLEELESAFGVRVGLMSNWKEKYNQLIPA